MKSLNSGKWGKGQFGNVKLILICRGKQQMTDYASLQRQVFFKAISSSVNQNSMPDVKCSFL